VSTDRQAEEGTGLGVQLDTIREWASAHSHKLTKPYSDEGVSGTNELAHRPALADAMMLLRQHKADGIVVYRLDRLARDLVLQEQLLREFRRLGADLYSTSEAENAYLVDDPKDPSRKMIRQILGVVSEYERSMIALRLRSARDRKALNGGYAGFGSPAYGLRSEGGELVAVADEQVTIRRIKSLRDEGKSIRETIAILDADGISPKRGGTWHPTTISRILNRSND
jgi:DNA invertase Pin-like site-specific DNA recombinase